jgi:hypothetical protein
MMRSKSIAERLSIEAATEIRKAASLLKAIDQQEKSAGTTPVDLRLEKLANAYTHLKYADLVGAVLGTP